MMPFRYMCPHGAQSDPAEVVMEQLQLRGFAKGSTTGSKELGQGDFGATNVSQLSNLARRFYCCDRYYYKLFCVCVAPCVVFFWPSAHFILLCFRSCYCQRWRQPSAVVGCCQLMCSYSYCLPVVEKVFRSFNGKLYLQDCSGKIFQKCKVWKEKNTHCSYLTSVIKYGFFFIHRNN